MSSVCRSIRPVHRTNNIPVSILRRPFRRSPAFRCFHAVPARLTDGVFRVLDESRVSTPWIEALRRQKEGHNKDGRSGASTSPVDRDLSPKKMSDSYHSVILPLAQDPWLSDKYLNSSGHIRLGTIFMDLDALSGVVAYKHTGDGVTTVTAACDRINIKHPLKELCDLEYSGQVTYASGRSSMEITCQVAKAPKPGEKAREEDVLILCTFTMVALDPQTKKPINIPGLSLSTPEERKLFTAGEVNSKRKKELSKRALLKHTPNDEESDLIHSIWLRQLAYHDPNVSLRLPANVHQMSSTVLRTASIMQPQYRNWHQFMIFGGFLLKQTFELAFCCCASFAHARPTFVSLDPSTFLNPVPVGSVLYLTATVTYTDPPLLEADEANPVEAEQQAKRQGGDAPGKAGKQQTRIHIRVDGKVRDVEHGQAKPTGQFNYTFTVDKDIKVIPQTYQEYMLYIDARRRVKRMAEDDKGPESVAGIPGEAQKDRVME